MSEKTLIEKMKVLLEKRGKNACKLAEKEILSEKLEYKPLREALQYFMQETWHNFQHPALLSLACESVGGKPEKTTSIGAALVLLTGGADIHDDIIDQSKTKGSKPTVFGKFGRDISLLVGDALLLKGATLLYNACENLPKKQRTEIIKLVKDAFFEIGMAEAKETSLKGNWDLTPKEYLDVIIMKAAIAEATARIGAILGEGSFNEIEALSKYGRIWGILATIRDDYIDTFEPDELKNRVENECLPLPILYAFCDQKAKKKIINILRKRRIQEKDAFKIVKIITDTKGMQALRQEVQALLRDGVQSLKIVKRRILTTQLKNILHATVESL